MRQKYQLEQEMAKFNRDKQLFEQQKSEDESRIRSATRLLQEE